MSVLDLHGSNVVSWSYAPSGVDEAEVVFGGDDVGAGAVQVGVVRLAARHEQHCLGLVQRAR